MTERRETVLVVKGNQPTMFADLATYFADAHATYQEAETWDRCRRRIEPYMLMRGYVLLQLSVAGKTGLSAEKGQNVGGGG